MCTGQRPQEQAPEDPEIMALIEKEKVVLTSWRELHARRKALGK